MHRQTFVVEEGRRILFYFRLQSQPKKAQSFCIMWLLLQLWLCFFSDKKALETGSRRESVCRFPIAKKL